MRTSKAISTISYNSEDYLRLKLEELRKAKRISEWYYIKHKAEKDEGKDHIHLYIMPSQMLQTDDLITEFAEYDPAHPLKPLTCPRWQSSKFGDWYLYGIHDEMYLASKGQTRQFHYTKADVVAFDDDALNQCIRELDIAGTNRFRAIKDAIEAGMTLERFVLSGGVPMQLITQVQKAWELLSADPDLYRDGRETHTPLTDIDTETGEVKNSDC